MNNTTLFLKNIHLLAQKLSWIESDSVIDELKDLFIANSSLLHDDENTTSFINELIYCAEKNVTPEDVEKLISHLNSFFIYYLSTQSFHVVFVGENWSSYQRNALYLPFNMERITSFDVSLETDPECIRLDLDDDTLVPILVTDYIGYSFLKKNNIQLPDILTFIQFPKKNTNRFNTDIGYIPLLNSRYEKLINEPDIKSVILGSSYAYQGFPQQLLEKAVNLSIFSGDFTLAYSLIKKITEITNTRNFIICIGFYDVFYEFSMGEATTFPVSRYFCKSHNIEYNFRSKVEKPKSETSNHTILGPLDLLVQQICKKKHPHYFNDEELSSLNSLLLDEAIVQQSVDFINTRNHSTDFSYSSVDILKRVKALAKNYQRKHSYENNKKILSSLLSLINETNSNLHFIVIPFTQFYVDNFDKTLKDETLSYIKSITNGHNVFMTDLSTHKAFTPEDFYDSDHLNFNGAKKLCNLVKELGFEI
ncbi:hypothetical protein DXF93_05020 [Escherichia coli]|nr:hypothetical protein DXF93_05020 [Escherichia coli]